VQSNTLNKPFKKSLINSEMDKLEEMARLNGDRIPNSVKHHRPAFQPRKSKARVDSQLVQPRMIKMNQNYNHVGRNRQRPQTKSELKLLNHLRVEKMTLMSKQASRMLSCDLDSLVMITTGQPDIEISNGR
jgi:hypothetical protein